METETRARRSCANAVDNYVKNERGRLCDARDALERETRDAARARARALTRGRRTGRRRWSFALAFACAR